jgi:hypothetical protein
VEGDFVLRAIGPADLSLRPVDEQWKELVIRGAWTAGLDGGGKNPLSRDKNPKHRFNLSKAATVYIFVAIQIHDKRPPAGYFVYKQSAYRLRAEFLAVGPRLIVELFLFLATSMGSMTFSNGGSPGQAWKLTEGEFTVIPATFDGAILAPYVIYLYSDADMTQL